MVGHTEISIRPSSNLGRAVTCTIGAAAGCSAFGGQGVQVGPQTSRLHPVTPLTHPSHTHADRATRRRQLTPGAAIQPEQGAPETGEGRRSSRITVWARRGGKRKKSRFGLGRWGREEEG